MGKGKKSKADKRDAQAQKAQSKREERAARKQAHKQIAKKRGRQTSDEDIAFEQQLASIGLRVIQISPDGNCMFRSISYQLTGTQNSHHKYRKEITDYITMNKEYFEPFMEDDESFDDYIDRMRSPGQWGGHQELYAASQCFSTNFIIHQYEAPRLELHAPDPARAKATLHLSYHGENHYNAVRAADDDCSGPAQPIVLDGCQIPERTSAIDGDGGGTSEDAFGAAAGLVRISIPQASAKQIRDMLAHTNGNAEEAIELLIQGVEPSVVSGGVATPDEAQRDKDSRTKGAKEKRSKGAASGDTLEKVARADLCPCGSKLKYKKCCMKRDKKIRAATAKANRSKQKSGLNSPSGDSPSSSKNGLPAESIAKGLSTIVI